MGENVEVSRHLKQRQVVEGKGWGRLFITLDIMKFWCQCDIARI